MNSDARPLRLVIPVWGGHYIDKFETLTLPFLLARGNLPDIARPDLFRLRLVTQAADVDRLEASPGVARARRHVGVDIVALPDDFPERLRRLPLFSRAYAIEIEEAREQGEDLILLCSDSVLSGGSLTLVDEARAGGARCVFIASFRVDWTAAASALAALRSDATGAIEVPIPQLIRVAVDSRHDWTRRIEFGDGFVRDSAGIYWFDDGGNFLINSLMWHPLYVDTRAVPADFAERSVTAIDGDLPTWLDCRLDELHFVEDSGRLFAFEVSDAVALPERVSLAGGREEWLRAWIDAVAGFGAAYCGRRPGLPIHLAAMARTMRGGTGQTPVDPWLDAASARLSEEVVARLRPLLARAVNPER